MIVENRKQWKFYKEYWGVAGPDVTVEDELAEKSGVPLSSVIQLQRKHSRIGHRGLRLINRSKPIVTDTVEVERDLTRFNRQDIADMTPDGTPGKRNVPEPMLRMNKAERKAYADYLNPTGRTPYSYGGDSWQFTKPESGHTIA
jgi:hypothetical protein